MTQEITGKTTLCGLLGSPVSHSISPAMHNEAFRQLGLDYAYLAFDVDCDHLKTALDGLKVLGFRGLNVTMPDKNLICEYMDHLSDASKIVGAVNTVVNDNGILTGHITDGTGYVQAMNDAGFSIVNKKITLLGAGGAATAILVQAALDGAAQINVFNRKDSFFGRAQNIVDTLNRQTSCNCALYEVEDSSALQSSILESDILTNATSVGMSPNIEDCIIHPSMLKSDLIVFDVIYNPRQTKLLRMAKEIGCSTVNGLYMLLYQGAASFKLWTGQDMPISIIKQKYFS